jgi:hypothetical protein
VNELSGFAKDLSIRFWINIGKRRLVVAVFVRKAKEKAGVDHEDHEGKGKTGLGVTFVLFVSFVVKDLG